MLVVWKLWHLCHSKAGYLKPQSIGFQSSHSPHVFFLAVSNLSKALQNFKHFYFIISKYLCSQDRQNYTVSRRESGNHLTLIHNVSIGKRSMKDSYSAQRGRKTELQTPMQPNGHPSTPGSNHFTLWLTLMRILYLALYPSALWGPQETVTVWLTATS